jgi:hypothetical protein
MNWLCHELSLTAHVGVAVGDLLNIVGGADTFMRSMIAIHARRAIHESVSFQFMQRKLQFIFLYFPYSKSSADII